MLLLVGLGNPNPNNSTNRHNVGFLVIDAINQKFKLSKQKPKFKGLLTTGNIEEQKVFAIKPLTFMNSSGICIKELIEYFKIDVKNVFVFQMDEIELIRKELIIHESDINNVYLTLGAGFITNKNINLVLGAAIGGILISGGVGKHIGGAPIDLVRPAICHHGR